MRANSGALVRFCGGGSVLWWRLVWWCGGAVVFTWFGGSVVVTWWCGTGGGGAVVVYCGQKKIQVCYAWTIISLTVFIVISLYCIKSPFILTT